MDFGGGGGVAWQGVCLLSRALLSHFLVTEMPGHFSLVVVLYVVFFPKGDIQCMYFYDS